MCVIHGHYPKGLFLLQNLPSLQRFVLCFVSSSWCSHVKVWKVNVHIGSTRSWSHVVALARSLSGCTGGFLCVCVPSSPDILLSELGRKTTQWDFVIGMASPSLSAGRTAPVWERSYSSSCIFLMELQHREVPGHWVFLLVGLRERAAGAEPSIQLGLCSAGSLTQQSLQSLNFPF